jgi:hypothetical protein
MFKTKNMLFLIIPMTYFIFSVSITFSKDQVALNEKLSYLSDIPEISWVEIENNNVFIGFNTIPTDLSIIVRGAAVQGNLAYGFGVHVWAVKAEDHNWRPGSGPYYCEATARSGKITKSNCK